jgi:hypothetical protein
MSVKLSIIKGADGAHTITGYDTYDLKEVIKSCGGKWAPSTKSWVVPCGNDLAQLELAIADLTAKRASENKEKRAKLKAERAFALTEEGRALAKEKALAQVKACLAEKAKTGAYHWICCEKCEVIDWQRQHTSCWDCGSDNGLWRDCFRVRGRLYTGD